MASKSNGVEAASEWARAPPSGPVWRRVAKAIYNPKEKTFLGRTAKRWGIVVIFYTVFYAVLALLFALCMGGLFLTLDPTTPKYILDKSLIGQSPGVASRPRAENGEPVRYDARNESHYNLYTDQLHQFLSSYQNESWYTSEEHCNADDNYGYPDKPCFFIKLNKVFAWKPEYYDVDTYKLPEDMPADLVEHIMSLDPAERKQVWITCWEETGNATSIEYPWGRGLPARFYPYMNDAAYRSPLVAVRLVSPVNTLTTVRCRAWAKNIIYNKSIKESSGYTRIQLFVEDSSSNSTDTSTEHSK